MKVQLLSAALWRSTGARRLASCRPDVPYCGGNLDMLRCYLTDASVDLVYLDPPFDSTHYNVIIRDESGNATDAQLFAFEDTWHVGGCA